MAALIVVLQVATPALASGLPPVALDASGSTPSRPLFLSLPADDPEFDTLTYAVVTQPAHGTLGDCTAGSCYYTPAASYLGPDSFTWKANDGTSDSNTATFSISVTANHPPVASDASTSTPSRPVFLYLNANDPDLDTLTYAIVAPPTHGTLGNCTGGSCYYTPAPTYVGPDSFTWKANDGFHDSNIATFTIDVAANQPPVAQAQSRTVFADEPQAISLSALDPEGDTLAFAIVTPPAHGTLNDCTGGSCTYSPAAGYLGPDSFTWKANDGHGDSNVATFSLTVAVRPTFARGDVFAGVGPGADGNGQVKQFSNTGTLVNTLIGLPTAYNTGMAFDSAGNLYSTGFSGNISKFDNQGRFLAGFGSGFFNPESIVFDAAGNAYVGDAGSPTVRKFDPSGAPIGTFSVAVESRGTDWIDLAGDQCTLFYTSEGQLVKRYNVCTSTQLADFARLPTSAAYALRIRPNGEVLVAATSAVHRLDASGAVLQSYTVPGTGFLFALNLDPDGTSFWTGDIGNGEIARVAIADGTILGHFNATPNSQLTGLAVFGEITAAQAHLTLSKAVENAGGGTAVATAWTLAASGPTPISGATGSAAVTNAVVSPGTYTLSESGGPAGYTPSAWSCTAGTLVGASLALAAGQSATCSITNTFVSKPPTATLTLVKKVDNTGGGTALETAWTLQASGPTPISGATGSAAVTNAVVTAGTYTLSESGPAGYTPSVWSCVGGTLTADSLILAADGSATCTITNTFVSKPPTATLTLVKKVDNTAGGTALETAWTVSANGPTPISGATGSGAVTNAVVTPGTYTLAESGPTGYSASAWSCTAGTLTGASLLLAAGDSASCTITNTFINTPPTVNAGPDVSGAEGSPIALDATVTDPDVADILTPTWSYVAGVGVDAGATCAFANAGAVDTTITCTDDGPYTVTLSVSDGHNPVVIDTATVTVANANPTVDITAPLAAASFGTATPVSLSAKLADAGANDTMTCSIDWGDGTPSATGSLTAGICIASHSYATAGDKTIVVTATDDDSGSGSDSVKITITAPGGPCSATDPTTTVERISPPVSVKLNKLTSNTCVRLFDELQDLTLGRSLKVDISKPGTYDQPRDLTPVWIPAGTSVDSHLLHADNIGRAAVRLAGSVTFDADIIGVIVLDRSLDRSDYLGSPMTSYPTELEDRGLELAGPLANGGDLVTISADRRTLTFNVRFSSALDQIRVLTANGPR